MTTMIFEGLKKEVPRTPLDVLLMKFRKAKIGVAELTGRGRDSIERSKKSITDFMNGDKFVAIISNAGSLGISLHADPEWPGSASRRRTMLMLELPWGATEFLQKCGRTYRTRKSMSVDELKPQIKIILTNMPGEKRFVSPVAQRMKALGATMQGDRNALGTMSEMGVLDMTDERGYQSLVKFVRCNQSEEISEILQTYKMIELKHYKDGDAYVMCTPTPEWFLNRLLTMPLKLQRIVFKGFQKVHESTISDPDSFDGIEHHNELVRVEHHVEEDVEIHKDAVNGTRTMLSAITVDKRMPADVAWTKYVELSSASNASNGSGLYMNPTKYMILLDASGKEDKVYSAKNIVGNVRTKKEIQKFFDSRNYSVVNGMQQGEFVKKWTQIFMGNEQRSNEYKSVYKAYLITGNILPVLSRLLKCFTRKEDAEGNQMLCIKSILANITGSNKKILGIEISDNERSKIMSKIINGEFS